MHNKEKTREVKGKKTEKYSREPEFDKEAWNPKTSIGKKIKAGEITKIDEILDNGLKILEPEIVDVLLPNLKTELLLIGQSKGKFGGGQLSIIKIKRGCGSWQCSCGEPHSIPFSIQSKCGSSIVKIMPAPKGKGLCIEKECQKILDMAGIKDVWSKTKGQTKVKTNLVLACFDALKQLSSTRVQKRYYKSLGIVEGATKKQEPETEEETMIDIIKKKVKKQEAKEKKTAKPNKEAKTNEILVKKKEKQNE